MRDCIREMLKSLGESLSVLEPLLWSELGDVEDGTPDAAREARQRLAELAEGIDRRVSAAVRHFGTPPGPVPETRGRAGRVVYVVKARVPVGMRKSVQPVAGIPGLALLPAPRNPAVERWQRVLPLPKPEPAHAQVLQPELLTAGHVAMMVRPSSDYESFLAKQLSPQTRRGYAADMKHFLDAAGLEHPEELLAVGPEMLIGYRNLQIEAGVAPATIARRLSVLRSFFSMLVTLGRIEQNPADPKLVRSPRVEREGKTPCIEPHEARALLRAPDLDTLIGKRDRAILAVGLYMGLRRAEIAGLNFSDMRQERGHHVLEVRGKGGMNRVLPIPPKAYSAIQEYLTAASRTTGESDAPLFPSMGHAAGADRRVSGQDVWNLMRKYAAQAGVNRQISPHSMRVAAITSALDHGAPIHRAQLMAGHADPKTTMRYYRAGEDLDESAVFAVRY